MAPFSARAADPDEIVGHVGRYMCRSIPDVDHWLTIIATRLRIVTEPNAWRHNREDLDALIDRRLELMGRS